MSAAAVQARNVGLLLGKGPKENPGFRHIRELTVPPVGASAVGSGEARPPPTPGARLCSSARLPTVMGSMIAPSSGMCPSGSNTLFLPRPVLSP